MSLAFRSDNPRNKQLIGFMLLQIFSLSIKLHRHNSGLPIFVYICNVLIG